MLEINVSSETEQVLKELAVQTAQDVAGYVSKIAENEISKKHFDNCNKD